MSGNVREWCQDWFGSSTYTAPDKTDPMGGFSGQNCITRGGYFGESAVTTAQYQDNSTFSQSTGIGFRIARPGN